MWQRYSRNYLRVDVNTSIHNGLPHYLSLPSFGLLANVSPKGDCSVGSRLRSNCSTNQMDADTRDNSVDGQNPDKDPTQHPSKVDLLLWTSPVFVKMVEATPSNPACIDKDGW